MKEQKVDVLSIEVSKQADAICFTSNGIVKSNGDLVMGAGNAKGFALRFPWLPKILGHKVKRSGNIPHCISYYNFQVLKPAIVSFPTKHHWRNPSDLNLIRQSAQALVKLADANGWNNVYLPRPGTGLGGLDWNIQVRPGIQSILDDRFIICHL